MLCGASERRWEDAAFFKHCKNGDLGAVSAAVGRDPSVAVRARDRNSMNGLMRSIWNGHAGVVAFVVGAAGADPDVGDTKARFVCVA